MSKTLDRERDLRRLFGGEYADHLLAATVGYRNPVPVGNSGLVVADGRAMARLAGGAIESFSDLIAKGTAAGGMQKMTFQRGMTSVSINRGGSCWGAGNVPPQGANPSGPPGGSVCDRTTTGALAMRNASAGSPARTRHYLTTQFVQANSGPHTLVLYDRLWHVRPALATGAQAITGTPTRYLAEESAGNLFWIEVTAGTNLSATAHNWTVGYKNQDGASKVQTVAGISACPINNMDMQTAAGFNLWNMPLLDGDSGVSALESISIDANIAAGSVNAVIGRPLVYLPIVTQNIPLIYDGVNTAFNLAEVKNDACLSHFIISGSGTSTTFFGNHEMVASD